MKGNRPETDVTVINHLSLVKISEQMNLRISEPMISKTHRSRFYSLVCLLRSA